MRRRWTGTAALGAVWAWAAICGADPTPAPTSAMLSVPGMPANLDVKTAPLAAWVKPGARVTYFVTHGVYYFASNQITAAQPGDQDQLSFRDPTDPTRWLVVHALRNEAVGHLVEASVVAVADGKVYCAMRRWQPGVANRKWLAPVPGPTNAVFPVGIFGENYLSPALLKTIPDVDAPDQKTSRMTVDYDGRKVDVLSFFTPSTKSVTRYDLDTGLLVSHSSQFRDKDYEAHFVGQSPQGALVINTSKLKGQRQLPYPWIGKPAPSWVTKIKAVTLHRKTVVTANPQPAGPMTLQDDEVKARVSDRGPDWLTTAYTEPPAKNQGASGPPPAETVLLSGAAAAPGSLFLPPAGLTDLKVGQVIDTDPATEMVLSVTRADREGNRNVIEFKEAGAGVTIFSKYNRDTGMLMDWQADVVTAQANGVAGPTVRHQRVTPTAAE